MDSLFPYEEPDFSARGFEEFLFERCHRLKIASFIEHWHYSGSVNGLMSAHCFNRTCEGEIVAAAIFGEMAMAGAWKKYVDSPDEIIELRRLCCIDKTPRNTESFFIGKCLRWLGQNTEIKKVISYADPNHGHQGII